MIKKLLSAITTWWYEFLVIIGGLHVLVRAAMAESVAVAWFLRLIVVAGYGGVCLMIIRKRRKQSDRKGGE